MDKLKLLLLDFTRDQLHGFALDTVARFLGVNFVGFKDGKLCIPNTPL